ncbi:MAG: hypothetical protein ABI591_10905 [Kofleriaceae bacterium]
MLERAGLVLGSLVVCASAIAAPPAERREFHGLSFALPATWKYESPAADGDHVSLTYLDKTRFCIVSLYESRSAGADLDAEFLREWKSVAGTIKDSAPKVSRRTLGGRSLVEATGAIIASDGATPVFERVAIVTTRDQLTTLVVLASNATTLQACRADSDAIVSSLAFPQRSAAQPAVPQPAAPTAPANGLAGTMKDAISLADLVGAWGDGAGLVTYGSGTGSMNGSTTTSASVAGTSYAFAANGTYTYKESGRYGNQSFHNTDSGKFVFTDGLIILTSKEGVVRKFEVIAYMVLANGGTVLTNRSIGELNPRWTPADVAKMCAPKNGVFACEYSDLWNRPAPGKK